MRPGAQIDRVLEQGVEAAVEEMFADASEEDADFQRVRDSIAGSLLDLDERRGALVGAV